MEDIADCLSKAYKHKELLRKIEDDIVRAIARHALNKTEPSAELAEVCKKISSDIASLLLLSKKIEELTPSFP